jgi:hypothetical protein
MSQAAVAIVSPEGDCGREQSGQTSSRCRVEVVSIPPRSKRFQARLMPDSSRCQLSRMERTPRHRNGHSQYEDGRPRSRQR